MHFSKKKRVVNNSLLKSVRKNPCCICGKKKVDAAHIKTRGSGGPDVEDNLVPLCRTHHIEQGQIGFARMFAKYPEFYKALREKGWELGNGKLYRTRILN